jgi:hypothetical protein
MTTTTATFEPAQAQSSPAAARNSLLQSLRPALQWRLMLLWLLALLLPTLAAALPVWTMLGEAFDHTVNAAALARRLDLVAIADVFSLHTRHASALAGGSGVALALTLLLSPLLTGAAITAARAPAPLGFAALAAGGVREYGRLLRMLLWAVVPLGVAAFLGALVLDAADGQAAGAVMGATLVAVLLALLAHATLDLGRAVLALDRRRSSAVLAWYHGLGVIARRPFAVFGLYAVVSLVGLGLAAALAVARLNLPALGAGSFLGGLLLAQLAVLALAWMRCARLFGLMELARGAGAR